MSAWNKFDVAIVVLSVAEAIASFAIGQQVNNEIKDMDTNGTQNLKILKLFKGMDSKLTTIIPITLVYRIT